jgi:uncharacterized protein YcaQ
LSVGLSLSELRRVTMAKQLLLAPLGGGDVVGAIERVCGLNAQTARGPYLSLWNRMVRFKKSRLAKALFEDRVLIKTWLMRGTVHIVSVGDYAIYQKALGRRLAERWRAQMEKMGLSLSAGRRRSVHGAILTALTERSYTKNELLPHIRGDLEQMPEKEQRTRLGYVMRELSYLGLVCHAQSTGPWYHFRENRFTTVEKWIGELVLPDVEEDEARKMLLKKYLLGYGPASVYDFSYWTGFSVRESREVFQALDDELTEVALRCSPHPSWMVADDLDSLNLGKSASATPSRLLPEFDPLIMGHKDKSRIIDGEDRKRIFLPLANVAPTILVDGRVIGVWNYKICDESFVLRLFREDGNPVSPELRSSVQSLQEFLASE